MSRLIEKYIRELFDEKEVPKKLREELWGYYFDKLSKAVDAGYSPKSEFYDKDLARALKHNIAQFCAFKETSFRNTLRDLLTKDGSLVPWSEFKKEAYSVSGDYNHRWLETEYHQTVANANMAEKWKDFERNADLYPNLKFVSVNDNRVRPEHKALDGTIRPINDPFWNKYTPPLDWGCRCHVVQTDEEPTEIKGGLQLKIEFENNPATSGSIFGGTAYEKGLDKKEKHDAYQNSINWLENLQKKNGKVTFDKDYDVSDFERNKYIAEICAKQTGFNFHIRKHLNITGVTNPEYLINNLFLGDRKSVENTGKAISNRIDKSKDQMLNKKINPHQMPYYIVWDFDSIPNLNIDELKRNITRKITPTRGTKIRGMFFQYKGKAVYVSREDILERNMDALNLL